MDIVNLAYDLLIIILPFLAAAAVELLRRKLGVEKIEKIQRELEAKQELGTLAVKFVEQAFYDLKGYDKYTTASYWLSEMLRERGIKVTDGEIKGLIESSLRTLKDEFGEEWAKGS